MKTRTIKLPECGMFIGTGVYGTSADYLVSGLYAHQTWSPQSNDPLEALDLIIKENQGNVAQLWGSTRGYSARVHDRWFYALDEIGIDTPEPDFAAGTHLRRQESQDLKQHADRNGAGVLRFIKAAAERGIYTTLIYVYSLPQWAERFAEAGEHYLGYDFGERFTFRFELPGASGNSGESGESGKQPVVTLASLADDLIARVKEHVDLRRASGWGPIMATSLNFYIDYEIVAGADIPMIEDFAFSHLNMASALSRGLYRQFDLPMWGSHLAHEHYSWLPYSHPRKFDLLRVALMQKYMAGCKMVINESGNWFLEASLCEDSPKFDFPQVPLDPSQISWDGAKPIAFTPYIEEARKHYHKVDFNCPQSKQYRKVISDFYDFVKANGTPQGQPQSTLALIKGNYDLAGHRFSPHAAVGGANNLADHNPAWLEGAPERGWEIARKVFYPLMPVLAPQPNRFLSGTPWGMADIVSFAKDKIDAAFLNSQYRALLFTGWNTASIKQYDVLQDYVQNGGTLFLSIAHLSTDITRNYAGFTKNDLVHQGDFSALCGLKVVGKGRRIYWATAPRGSNELGFSFPRRFGIIGACIGELEITDPAMEVLVVDDERAQPVVLRRKLGKGQVYFLNTWAYPGAVNTDEGPGAILDSPGLVGTIYRHIAAQTRGDVWITDDGLTTGQACNYITWSYFPEADKICLLNIDADNSHRFHLHQADSCEAIELSPGEFRMLNISDLAWNQPPLLTNDRIAT